jgi:hypothetical protein
MGGQRDNRIVAQQRWDGSGKGALIPPAQHLQQVCQDARRQRLKYPKMAFRCPNSRGTSRHWQPILIRYNTH